MLKTSILALCAALTAGAAVAHEYGYERGDPRAPGGWERGSGYEYGDPRGDHYSAGHRYESRSEYDSGWVGGDRYGATGDYRYGGDYGRADDLPRPRTYSLPTYGGAMQAYGYPCGCAGGYAVARGGEVSVPGHFFYDTGGVGPIPDGGYYGGGGGYVIAGAGAGASASAYASSRSSVSVRVGGWKGGHGGGKGCCHGGKGK